MSDKDFKVKNKLQVKGITSAGPLISDASGNIDSTTYIATQYGGTGTSTSPNSGQLLYSSSGTTYSPTTLTSLDVKGATYSSTAPSSPVTGQVWVDSSADATAFDTNIIRRQSFTATAGQTVFTTTVSFIDTYEQVFFNGLLLLRTTDYTTSNNNTITLASGAAAGDIVEVVTVTNLNSTNTYTQAEIQAGYVSKSGGSTITASSASVIPLIAKAAASQTANLQEWQANSGYVYSRIDSYGNFVFGGAQNYIVGALADYVPLIIRGAVSHTANLQQWQNSNGTILGAVNASGGLELNGKDVEIMNIMGAF